MSTPDKLKDCSIAAEIEASVEAQRNIIKNNSRRFCLLYILGSNDVKMVFEIKRSGVSRKMNTDNKTIIE